MLSALGTRLDTCSQTPTASLLMRSASITPSHPFTAAQTLQLLPTACRLTATLYFLSMSSSMASDITHLGQLVRTSCCLSVSSSQAPLQSLATENCLKSSSLVKTLDKQHVHCGWHGCAGSCHGTESKIVSGTTCESPSPIMSHSTLSTYSSLAALSMFSSGNWGSIKTMMCLHYC